MSFENSQNINSSMRAINESYLCDETELVNKMIETFCFAPELENQVEELARNLVQQVRSKQQAQTSVKALIHEYNLSTQEGIVLMCLAEALLRIPDGETADKLIRDKLNLANWESHIGRSQSWLVNASAWAMALTGKLVHAANEPINRLQNIVDGLVGRIGEPFVRAALKQGMRAIGQQFVMGATIEQAIARSREYTGNYFSFDMLGEAALTTTDSDRYFESYANAIKSIGLSAQVGTPLLENPGISVKLSALHPRYELFKRTVVFKEMYPRILSLAQKAKEQNISMTIDAEESERLGLSLEIFAQLISEPVLKGWNGLGLAVQAYQKRALDVIDFLAELAQRNNACIPIRLVKGAYWDSEIKRAQERGYTAYPVFTRKPYTDLSYLACVQKIFKYSSRFYPQFATHNAHTIASIVCLADGKRNFEFQRLHGMGEDLYDAVTSGSIEGLKCRIYAPVGRHQELLPYLVRRLLENGANTSFVNRVENELIPIDEIIEDPFSIARQYEALPNENIPLPINLYGQSRANSQGLNFYDPSVSEDLLRQFERMNVAGIKAGPIIDGKILKEDARPVLSPSSGKQISTCAFASEADLSYAVSIAEKGFQHWVLTPALHRIECFERAADLFEQKRDELIQLCVLEGGRTIPDALAEVREAVDYCRYYAAQARQILMNPVDLPGPTGEQNSLFFAGRGIYVCISPWNFPVAIFTGQIIAALICGNSVIAKPASHTTITAFRCCQILYEAGIPNDVLQFAPSDAKIFSKTVISDPRISGVAFTGSTETALAIQQHLIARGGVIVPLIAETGGQNIMIADSSALPEQVVIDAVQSAFNSAGQRCSALRVLFVQEDIADRVLELLVGYTSQLTIGESWRFDVDVGPVISLNARDTLRTHVNEMTNQQRLVFQSTVPENLSGYFFGPAIIKLDYLGQLKREIFGPVLHVITFKNDAMDRVIEAVNHSGYGLTLGIHSRIDQVVDYVVKRVHVGNIYVNRNMIGAVVGVQPFGGEGLSGTGPKAGGPNYLQRFCVERTVSINTAAAGGNINLLRDDKL